MANYKINTLAKNKINASFTTLTLGCLSQFSFVFFLFLFVAESEESLLSPEEENDDKGEDDDDACACKPGGWTAGLRTTARNIAVIAMTCGGYNSGRSVL